MAYVAPSTVTTLQTYTSSAHNIIVNDIIDHETRIGALYPNGRQPAVMASLVSGASYTPGVNNPIPFGAENYDTDNFHDNTTNNSRITIPTGLGGTYLFEVNVMFNFSVVPTYAEVNIRCNGTMENNKAIRGGMYQLANWGANNSMHAMGIAYGCSATDYFDVCLNVSGGTYTSTPLTGGSTTVTPTYFRAIWIAP